MNMYWMFFKHFLASTYIAIQPVYTLEIPIISLVPCKNTTNMTNTECDPFVYPSILEAIKEVNQNGVVIKNNKQEMLAVKIQLFQAITEVINS